jgi:hypothetical protein
VRRHVADAEGQIETGREGVDVGHVQDVELGFRVNTLGHGDHVRIQIDADQFMPRRGKAAAVVARATADVQDPFAFSLRTCRFCQVRVEEVVDGLPVGKDRLVVIREIGVEGHGSGLLSLILPGSRNIIPSLSRKHPKTRGRARDSQNHPFDPRYGRSGPF